MNFRHDLRTPLNHLIGYGEILIENLEDEGRGERDPVATALRRVIARARELVHQVQSLPVAQVRTAVEMAALPSLLAPAEGLMDGPYADDLKRMKSAAEQLAALAVSGVQLPPEPAAAIRQDPARDGAAASGHLLGVDDNA